MVHVAAARPGSAVPLFDAEALRGSWMAEHGMGSAVPREILMDLVHRVLRERP